MARGFESKSVADQQELADAPVGPREEVGDPKLAFQRQRLDLARRDILHRLETANAPAHRQMLERALQAVDAEIKSLGAQ